MVVKARQSHLQTLFSFLNFVYDRASNAIAYRSIITPEISLKCLLLGFCYPHLD
jgi:hypothetical protein